MELDLTSNRTQTQENSKAAREREDENSKSAREREDENAKSTRERAATELAAKIASDDADAARNTLSGIGIKTGKRVYCAPHATKHAATLLRARQYRANAKKTKASLMVFIVLHAHLHTPLSVYECRSIKIFISKHHLIVHEDCYCSTSEPRILGEFFFTSKLKQMLPEYVKGGYLECVTPSRHADEYQLPKKYKKGQKRRDTDMDYRIRICFNRRMSILDNPFQRDPLKSLLEVGFEADRAIHLSKQIADDKRSVQGDCSECIIIGKLAQKTGNALIVNAKAEIGTFEPVELLTVWKVQLVYSRNLKKYVVANMVPQKNSGDVPIHLVHWGLQAPVVEVTDHMLEKLLGSCRNEFFDKSKETPRTREKKRDDELLLKAAQNLKERAAILNALPFPRPPLLCGECSRRKEQGRKPRVSCENMTLRMPDASGLYTNDNTLIACCKVAQNSIAGVAKVFVYGEAKYVCGSCRATANKMKGCECKCVSYCDKECQKKHWRKHRITCPLQNVQDDADELLAT